jgi:transposase
MIIEVDMYEKIRQLYVHESKSQRQIAKLLGISRITVKKYCEGDHVPWERSGTSGRKPYVVTPPIMEFIASCLEEDAAENIKKQKHTARRIYDRLVDEQGFTGGESTVRQIVAELRQKTPQAFIPLSFEPGEAVQIDWGEATVYLQAKKVKVYLFCMRQCFSADMFVKAFYRQNEESFLEGNMNGFEHFEGVPAKVIFDNAKVAVKEGFGAHAKVQERYKILSAHYAFKTEFCNVAAGHEKGLVEGLVGWIRRNVLVPIPRVNNISELNEALLKRCEKYRKHKIDRRQLTVGQMVEIEKPKLIALPKYRFDTSKSMTAAVDTFSTIKFDHNYYSVPVTYVDKDVSIKGYGNEITIIHKQTLVATYPRCYGRGESHYKLEHYIDLIEQRPRSVFNAKPVKNAVSSQLMEIGRRLSGPREMVKLLRLCVDHGEDKVIAAADQLSLQDQLTIDQIAAYLMPLVPTRPSPRQTDEIKVIHTGLTQYDQLIQGDIAI